MSHSISILIVDDNQENARQLESVLKEFDYQAYSVNYPAEAAQYLLSHQVDILLVGLNMPVINGLELVLWAQQHSHQSYAAIMTDLDLPRPEQTNGLSCHVQVLQKPIQIDEVIQFIESHFHFQASPALNLLDILYIKLLDPYLWQCLCFETTQGSQLGKIYIAQGQLVHCEVFDLQQSRTKPVSTGEDALLQILQFEQANFFEDHHSEAHQKSLYQDNHSLLRRAQEKLDSKAIKAGKLIASNPCLNVIESTEQAHELLSAQIEQNNSKLLRETQPIAKLKTLDMPLATMLNVQYSDQLKSAIEIEDDIFWVSHRNPDHLLQINSYFRRFKGPTQSVNLLMEPGPVELFPVISAKVSSIIGDIKNIHMYSLSHQDPDVAMNSTLISKINPSALCLCTEETWRLVRFFDLPHKSFKDTSSFENHQIKFASNPNHILEIVPFPYCHFVGAFGIYDRATRALFTGDLFGGLNPPGNMSLMAEEEHWEGIKLFHQIYMPSKKAVQQAIRRIRALDPPPRMIVPQHGAIIMEDLLDEFMSRLFNLDMGLDLLPEPAAELLNDAGALMTGLERELLEQSEENRYTREYQDVMNTLLQDLMQQMSFPEIEAVFNFDDPEQDLNLLVNVDLNGVCKIHTKPKEAMRLFLNKIEQIPEQTLVNQLKSHAIKEIVSKGIPLSINDAFYYNNSL